MRMGTSVARVCVDSPLPHLDRLFDYAIPESLAQRVEVGTRVRVRFSGRLIDGFVCEIADATDFAGRLLPVASAGAVPSTTAAGIELARAVALRYGGSLWDVLRLAVPPRVASVERRWATKEATGPDTARLTAAHGLASGVALSGASGERVVWEAPPTAGRMADAISPLVASGVVAASSGRTAVLLFPDARGIATALGVLETWGLRRWTARSGGDVAVIHADDGPAVRFENYLAALRGAVAIVVGSRSSAFQPTIATSLIGVWDDGHSAFSDPHAPYPHARTVVAMRSEADGGSLIVGGFTPSVEALALVETGWATMASASRDVVKAGAPAVEVLTGEKREREGPAGWHWMPGSAWRHVRVALDRGPVFVLVPRTGYVQASTCSECGAWARCLQCEGLLARDRAGSVPRCLDCGREHPDWHCAECRSSAMSEARQGVERIAEQVVRMAPGVPVVVSSAQSGILADGAVESGIVVATPGALPASDAGYAAGVIVGAASGLGSMGSEVDSARLWLGAGALVKSRNEGGRLVVVGDVSASVRQAIETWTPGALAGGVARERLDLGLPPYRRIVAVEVRGMDVSTIDHVAIGGLDIATHPEISSIPAAPGCRTLLCSRRVAPEVIDALRAMQMEHSAAGSGEIRLRVDGPLTIPQ